ncbi:MAG TPA: threonine/serine dehydratase [Candidatus Dormibacteraeota bacterium]
METASVSVADIQTAAERIRPYVEPTPLLAADAVVGEGGWFKAESLQRTGSFKVRGAANALLQLSAEQRRQGVITLSAGNHGRALAHMARRLHIRCVVVIRDDAPLAKLDAIRREGAELVLVPMADWQARLEAEQERRGLHLVHPFDDPAVIAGQGTVGLEILQALPELATVLVPVGGGGLISGVATALKSGGPSAVRVIGVEPERAAVVSESLAAGQPVPPSHTDSIAEGLAPPYTRALNLEIIRRHVDEMRLVSDDAILDALRAVALDAKLVLEPAGAAGVAAALADASLRRPSVIILTGGNVDAQHLASWLG